MIFSDCVSQALCHPYNSNNSIVKWIQSEKVSRFFVNIVKEDLLENDSHVQLNILKQSFNENEFGGKYNYNNLQYGK